MKKGDLRRFIDREYKGAYQAAAIDMVLDWCEKNGIAGSTDSYDLYAVVQEAFRKALEGEYDHMKVLEEMFKD